MCIIRTMMMGSMMINRRVMKLGRIITMGTFGRKCSRSCPGPPKAEAEEPTRRVCDWKLRWGKGEHAVP